MKNWLTEWSWLIAPLAIIFSFVSLIVSIVRVRALSSQNKWQRERAKKSDRDKIRPQFKFTHIDFVNNRFRIENIRNGTAVTLEIFKGFTW